LEVFRDKQDFTGNEYHRSLETHLRDSAKLLVICSPQACKSEYVNDEIRQFARLKGPAGIIPILISGIPNNEARPGQEDQRAFPEALCEVIGMPLAADFRGFDPNKSRLNGTAYQDAWYTILANIYDVPRSEIEQRDKRRRARTRRLTVGVAVVILCLIATAAAIAWKSRAQTKVEAGRSRELRYIGNIGLAQQAYNATDLHGMVELLNNEIPPGGTNAPSGNKNDLRGFEWFYLWRLSQGPSTTMNLGDSFAAAAFRPDGTTFATAGKDGTVKFWSLDLRKELGQLGPLESAVTGLAFSPDGKLLATVGDKSSVRLWDASSRTAIANITALANIKDLGSAVDGIAFSPDGKALAGVSFEDGKKMIRVWDTVSRTIVTSIAGDSTASASEMFVRFSPDGTTLAASSGFGVRLCRFPSGEMINEFDGPGVYVTAIAFSPDGKTLAAASENGKVLFYDLKAARKYGAFVAHDDYLGNVAFSADGKLLVTSSSDKTIKVWDAKSHALLNTLKGHTTGIQALAISPDARTVLSAGDKTVRRWELSTRPEYEELGNLDIMMSDIAPSPVDNRLALASASSIVIWEPSARKQLTKLADHSESINSLSCSPDGKTMAIASSGKQVELWDTSSQKTEKLAGHTGLVYSVAFSPNGKMLASTSADRTIRLWDVPSRQPSSTRFPSQTKAVTAVAFSPDGSTLATGSDDRTVKLWDLNTGQQIASAPAFAETFKLPPDFDESRQQLVTTLAFSPEGQTLASAGVNGAVALWRVAKRTLERYGTLAGHTGIVNRVVFSPDGRTIATGSADGTVRLWNAALGRELITFKETKTNRTDLPHFLFGTENQVSALAFSHDGQFLVSGLMEGTVRVRRGAAASR
jgi:WD40 repeat protein